jgi:flagellar hook protein FlgE
LVKVGDNLYSGQSLAGELSTPGAPNANGLGSVQSGYLEMSNVDLASQLTSLITTQRAYEANSKVVTTSDDILQTLINLKQG